MLFAIVAVLVVAVLALLAYVKWFAVEVTAALPYCQVELVDSAGPGVSTADVTLVGTGRSYRLVRVTHQPNPNQPPLPRPPGFEVELDVDFSDDTMSWIPTQSIVLVPGRPFRIPFQFDEAARNATRVTGWVETKVGMGGSATFFNVPVGPHSDAERVFLNLNSRVRAESVARGIRPVDHPEWAELRRLEASMRREPD